MAPGGNGNVAGAVTIYDTSRRFPSSSSFAYRPAIFITCKLPSRTSRKFFSSFRNNNNEISKKEIFENKDSRGPVDAHCHRTLVNVLYER